MRKKITSQKQKLQSLFIKISQCIELVIETHNCISINRQGWIQSKAEGGQLIIGALINFQKFVAREPTTRLLYSYNHFRP